jgi:hypothetical protein
MGTPPNAAAFPGLLEGWMVFNSQESRMDRVTRVGRGS